MISIALSFPMCQTSRRPHPKKTVAITTVPLSDLFFRTQWDTEPPIVKFREIRVHPRSHPSFALFEFLDGVSIHLLGALGDARPAEALLHAAPPRKSHGAA